MLIVNFITDEESCFGFQSFKLQLSSFRQVDARSIAGSKSSDDLVHVTSDSYLSDIVNKEQTFECRDPLSNTFYEC